MTEGEKSAFRTVGFILLLVVVLGFTIASAVKMVKMTTAEIEYSREQTSDTSQ